MSSFFIPERSTTHAPYPALSPMLLAEEPQQSPRQVALDQFQSVLKACSKNPFCIREDLTEFLEEYTADELNRLYIDLQAIGDRIFKHARKEKIYIATAGAPGSGKTALIERYFDHDSKSTVSSYVYSYIKKYLPWAEGDLGNDSKNPISSYVYINRKKYLSWMEKTYQQDIQQSPNSAEHQQIYNYWKNANSFLNNVFLIIGFKGGYAIIDNSNLCNKQTGAFLKKVSSVFHYHMTILHITCEDEIRKRSLQKIQAKTQVSAWSEEDFITMGKQFSRNLPIHLKNSDQILFFHRKTEDQIVLAAKKQRGSRCIIHNSFSCQKIQTLHK